MHCMVGRRQHVCFTTKSYCTVNILTVPNFINSELSKLVSNLVYINTTLIQRTYVLHHRTFKIDTKNTKKYC